ncbi:MAG TPA: ArsB/NhaD family transporter [Thermotogota bacterium]|nr:ArsB/NhaD family transporter [Thermotogota bacterium]HPJ88298.1 ArsB/NhaD family transporter [Thermotogota bacterium]
MHALFALIVFSVVYVFIINEKINRTIIAVLGAVLLFFLKIFGHSAEAITTYIDFNTIFLLIGMMILVSATKQTGFFEMLALKIIKRANGSVLRIFLYVNLAVAFFSAFLDNVTTLLIFIPITFAVIDIVKIDPVFFILSEIMSSNIGGTSTLIGDPPNILIGSTAKLSFLGFLKNTGVIAILSLIVVLLVIMFMNRKTLKQTFDPSVFEGSGTFDRRKLRKAGILLSITIILFITQEYTGVDNSIIALGMGFLSVLVIDPKNLENHLKEVEWETIFFFIGLFLLTGALEETGILHFLANSLEEHFGSSLTVFLPVMYLVAFIFSGFVDNIPFTATMIPVIKHLPTLNPTVFSNLDPLWWTLSIGVCFGGNLTPIGASANVVAITFLKKYEGKDVSYGSYLKFSLIPTLISMVMGLLYIFIRYI